MNLSEIIKSEYNKSISECTNEEIYNALLTLVKTMAEGKQHKNSKKKLYYISAEFLKNTQGKVLWNSGDKTGCRDKNHSIPTACLLQYEQQNLFLFL